MYTHTYAQIAGRREEQREGRLVQPGPLPAILAGALPARGTT